MLEIKSRTVQVNRSAESLFDHFSDLKNMYGIMPESVERFEADEETFLFGMKGMPDVRLLQEGKERPTSMRFRSASSKLDFHLFVNIEPKGDNSSEVSYEFAGKFNAMMRMMVEKPLRNFIEELANNTEKLQ